MTKLLLLGNRILWCQFCVHINGRRKNSAEPSDGCRAKVPMQKTITRVLDNLGTDVWRLPNFGWHGKFMISTRRHGNDTLWGMWEKIKSLRTESLWTMCSIMEMMFTKCSDAWWRKSDNVAESGRMTRLEKVAKQRRWKAKKVDGAWCTWWKRSLEQFSCGQVQVFH